MKSAAYIRVSTMKEEQALSLKNQQEFFESYITGRGDELVRIYSDQGKSATKMMNRTALQRLIKDAKLGKFEKIYAKDISRIFRNTLDFITFTRELMDKHGIQLHLVNFGEGKDIDTFTLGLMAMIAEHESRKISERVKFGKKFSKEKGIVPNFVFGYERIDKYTLAECEESIWLKKIFDLYTEEGWGEGRIAKYLHDNRVKTKKLKDGEPNYNWSARTVGGILSNQIYIGRVINGKQSAKDLYSGTRIDMDEEAWYVTNREEFRLISDEQFFKAQDLKKEHKKMFPSNNDGRREGTRRSEAALYSNLLRCPHCGSSYRRYTRRYSKNGPVYCFWVCGGRSKYGAAKCAASYIRLEETAITEAFSGLFNCLIEDKHEFFKLIEIKTKRLIKEKIDQISGLDISGIKRELKELQTERDNAKRMMRKGIIDIEEGEKDMKALSGEIERVSNLLRRQDRTEELTKKVKYNLESFFKDFSELSLTEGLDNAGLKLFIKEINVISGNELRVHFKTSDINGFIMPLVLG